MKWIFIILILVLLLSGCTETPTGMTVEQESDEQKLNTTETSKSMEVYFCPEDECREHLVEFLQGAKNYIHCAFYDVDLPEVINTLKEKESKIDVKLAIDQASIDKISGTNLVVRNDSNLMHNKFCIVDGEKVFTGSFNPTENCNFYNNNNMAIIYSKIIADNYEKEFQELWNKDFGQGQAVENPIIYLNNKKIENYFCPEDSCSQHVISNLAEANKEIYFMIFSFTDDDIGNELIEKHNNGIKIKGVLEKTRQSEFSEYDSLKKNGIDIKWDEYAYTMHNKVFIIDNKTVITGSFNPTESGDKGNDENLLIIHDENIAKKYLKEFEKIWNFKDELDMTERQTNSIVISEVYYDCTGKDEEEEFVELYNPFNEDINLDYYFISNGKNNQRLSGIIDADSPKAIKLNFSLNNKGGYLVLKEHTDQIDFVSWESTWDLEAKTGLSLQRKNFEKVNSKDQWMVGIPDPEKI